MVEWSTPLEEVKDARRHPVRGRVTTHRKSQIHIERARLEKLQIYETADRRSNRWHFLGR